MQNHEYETVKKLTYFPCIIAGKNGVHKVDEATFKKMFESGAGSKIEVLGFSNIETRQITENSAVIAYLIELKMSESEQNPSRCACTSTCVKENGSWVCALHTESELVKE